jgi:hypothetical protein
LASGTSVLLRLGLVSTSRPLSSIEIERTVLIVPSGFWTTGRVFRSMLPAWRSPGTCSEAPCPTRPSDCWIVGGWYWLSGTTASGPASPIRARVGCVTMPPLAMAGTIGVMFGADAV